MLQLWKQRSHKFHQRRIDDIKDEDNQINGKASTKKGLFVHISNLSMCLFSEKIFNFFKGTGVTSML